MTLEVGSPRSIRDALGNPILALPIRVMIELQIRGEARFSEFWQFVDSYGTKVVAASACPGLGGGFLTSRQSCAEGRISGSFMEYGLPGSLGVSKVWNRPISPPALNLSYSLAGREFRVEYAVGPWGPDESPGRACFRLDLVHGPEHPLDGQALSDFASIPTSLGVCTDSGLPMSVTFPGEHRLERVEFRPGAARGGLVPGPRARDPWIEATAPEATVPRRGSPHASDSDPGGFPIREAVTHLMQKDPTGRQFASRHGDFFLRYSTFESVSRGEKLSLLAGHSGATRSVEVEGPGGRVLTARIEKRCEVVTGCDVRTLEIAEKSLPPSATSPAALLSIPYDRLETTANRTLPDRVFIYSVGSVIPGESVDFGNGRDYLYTFYAVDSSSTLPYHVRLRGGNGGLLAFDLDERRGAALLGTDLERPRGP